MKMGGSVFEDKSSFKMLDFSSSSKVDWGSYIISIANTACKKIGDLILRSFFLLRLLYISIYLPYGLARNTVMSGLVALAATWKY